MQELPALCNDGWSKEIIRSVEHTYILNNFCLPLFWIHPARRGNPIIREGGFPPWLATYPGGIGSNAYECVSLATRSIT